jgi:tetratricopeptide (TPR) repeat protein
MRLWIIAFAVAASVLSAQTPNASPWYVSGRVMLDDGTAPPDPIAVQSVCNGTAYVAAYTDAKGQFSFRVGGSEGLLSQDASVGRPDPVLGRLKPALGGPGSATESIDRTTSTTSTTSATDPNPRPAPVERSLDNCELRVAMAGYLPARFNLPNRKPLDNDSIGTLVLRRLEPVEGNTVSVTALAAPKAARSAYEKGRKAAAKDKLKEARSQLEKAVRIYPDYAPAWTSLGDIQARQNQQEEAARSFERAIQADPKYVQPYIGLALIQAAQKQWDRLTVTTAHAIELAPADFPQAYYLDALANYNGRRYDAAEKSARQAEKLDNRHRWPQTWRILGMILASQREYAGAAAQFREYLELAPEAPDAGQVRTLLAQAERLSAAK